MINMIYILCTIYFQTQQISLQVKDVNVYGTKDKMGWSLEA